MMLVFQFPCLFEVPDVARMKILVAHEIFIRHFFYLLDWIGKRKQLEQEKTIGGWPQKEVGALLME